MEIGFATTTVDPLGGFRVPINIAGSRLGTIKRRAIRMATLDGGATLLDSGFSDADRIISLDVTQASEAEINQLSRLCRYYSQVLVFLPEGAFTACPESVIATSRSIIFQLLIMGEAVVCNA